MTETQNIEYKSNWHDDYLKWICGFANSQGGRLFVGKEDSGKVVGISNAKRLMEEIPNKVRDILGLVVEVNLFKENNLEYLEIVVSPSTMAISLRSRYYIRSGNTNSELSGSALNDFLLKKMGLTWDDIDDDKAKIDDIDPTAIEYFKKEAVRSKRMTSIEDDSTEIVLTNLKMLNNNVLKRSAVLLFAKEPTNFYINAYAKIGLFGESDSDLRSQEVIEGNVFQMPSRIIEILDKKYFVNNISYEGLHRREIPPYPIDAIREILINAVIHRDYLSTFIQISIYDDKIMFWNPGLLPKELSFEDLTKKHTSYPRNPNLASVFFKAGLVESWGRGTIKIIEECKKHGIPEPEFGTLTGGFYVTLFKNRFSDEQLNRMNLNDRQIKAVKYVKENISISNSIYQEICGTTRKTALRDLDKLVELNVFVRIGEKKTTIYKLAMAHK